ncbi:MAG: hypothetical protein HGN29_01560 [Asgard group archaeon]|nr:hypothetical protein [Asgard group archaeon]
MNYQILVDGQNLLRHRDGTIKLQNLIILRSWANKNGIEIKVILPDSRRYKERIEGVEDIVFINYHVHDDSALIQLAIDLDLPILSNDKFRNFMHLYPEFDFKGKVFSFDIVLGVLVSEIVDDFKSQNEKFPQIMVNS